MGLIKKFKDYFFKDDNLMLDNQDLDYIKDLFNDLFDEMSIEGIYRKDYKFYIFLDSQYHIKGKIKFIDIDNETNNIGIPINIVFLVKFKLLMENFKKIISEDYYYIDNIDNYVENDDGVNGIWNNIYLFEVKKRNPIS